MIIPPKPPKVDMSDAAQVQKALGLFPFVIGHKEKYLHWDEQRNRPVPVPDVSHEDWWVATKIRRMTGRTYFPLKSTSGPLHHFVNGEDIQAAVHQIDMIAAGQVSISAPLVTAEEKDRYLVRSLVEEAIHSSQLEGATTTRLVAKRMIREGRTPTDPSERMILNNFHTMTQLAEWRNHPLTPELVLEIHRRVTEGTFEKPDISGRLRRSDEPVEVGNDYGEDSGCISSPVGSSDRASLLACLRSSVR